MIRNRMNDADYGDYLYQRRKDKEAEEHFAKLEKQKKEKQDEHQRHQQG